MNGTFTKLKHVEKLRVVIIIIQSFIENIKQTNVTWKLGVGLGYGSQAEREFSWNLKGPLKTCDTALRLKAHTADAAMLFLVVEHKQEENGSGCGSFR